MKPVVVDAATALRILMPPDDKVADPSKETEFIEQTFRAGRIRMWGLRGEDAVEHEPVLPERVSDLKFNWLARKSEVDDQLAEADLVTPFNGRVLPYEPVWLNLRFDPKEIESARPDFVAWQQGREADASLDPPRSMRARIAKMHIDNPDLFGWNRERLIRKIKVECGAAVDPRTVSRGRSDAREALRDKQGRGGTSP